MNKKSKRQIRIRLVDSIGNTSYVIVTKGNVTYCSGGETPLALSNMFGDNAAEVRFALQDSANEAAAIKIVRKYARLANTIEIL